MRMLSKNNIALYIFSLSWLICSGCTDYYAEQSRRNSDQILNDIREREESRKQREIEQIAPAIYEAQKYVEQYSTKKMKGHISRGELVIGMNQKEVLASLNETNFRYGVPVTANKYSTGHGTFETWKIGGRTGNRYYSYSLPKYMLDFTDNLLNVIYEP